MTVNSKAIGRNIRNARKAQGMTQEKLAECMGVSSAYIGKLERGERTANLDNLSDLANILAVPIEALVQGSVPIKNDEQLPNDFLDAVREITKGCSQHTLQTMLDVLITMARHDKEN